MKRGRALTLLEMLLTLGIFSMVLGVAATLMHSYLTHKRHRDQEEKALLLVALGLERVVREVESSEQLIQTGPRLVFRRINPQRSRLPADPPAVLPALWDSQNGADRITVEYALTDKELFRTVTFPDQRRESMLIAEGVTLFDTQVRSRFLEIRLQSQSARSPVRAVSELRL